MKLFTVLIAVSMSVIGGCKSVGTHVNAASAHPSGSNQPTNPDEELERFFAEAFELGVSRSPVFQTQLGIKTDYGQWDDLSDERAHEDNEIAQQQLARLREFDFESLSDSSKLSYRLFERQLITELEGFRWRLHNYPINQMRGLHSFVPAFLINFHRVVDVQDARAYLSRLRGIQPLMAQVEEGLATRDRKGISAPRFVFDLTLNSSRNVLEGRPFEPNADKDSTLLADFKKKLGGIESLTPAERDALTREAEAALLESVQPAYRSLIARLERAQQKATTDDGAWKFPDGDAFYDFALRRTTTTDLSADEIHQIGLSEVDRIHDEMRAIMKKVDFEGSLQDFFEFMRKDPRFYYDNNDEGREAYLSEANKIIDAMRERLPELFNTFPKAELTVKRVEPFRERGAGKAFYTRPAPDGSRPGIYYANLFKMSDMPTYQMEALAYHEAIPGHHMQRAISMELDDIPDFRRFGGYTAYTEGWGLYSESVPKELGFYSDPYSDFGRLAMELWRACRLVVDTGIHRKKWSRERAIDYLKANTPNPQGDIVKAIERYIVMPSQATAYKIGMLKILELREYARTELGEDFDIREFHDVVLTNGAVPLDVLEDLVTTWVEAAQT